MSFNAYLYPDDPELDGTVTLNASGKWENSKGEELDVAFFAEYEESAEGFEVKIDGPYGPLDGDYHDYILGCHC